MKNRGEDVRDNKRNDKGDMFALDRNLISDMCLIQIKCIIKYACIFQTLCITVD